MKSDPQTTIISHSDDCNCMYCERDRQTLANSKTMPRDRTKERLESMKRGIEAVLLDAHLHDEEISRGVLLCLRRDIDAALRDMP